MDKKFLQGIISATIKSKSDEHVQMLTKEHQNKAKQFFKEFQDDFKKKVDEFMRQINTAVNKQLDSTVRKLETKLKGPYSTSISDSIKNYFLAPFVAKEVEDVYKSLSKLKSKIFEYISQFCNNILSRNIDRSNQLSLYHYSNDIKSLDKNWRSVSSRSSVSKAEIIVKGFNRPQTTWLALGVTKKMKQFGPIKSTFNKQDFMGNIYLNGSDEMIGEYKLKRDLNNNDVFIVDIENRMVWVYRKIEGRNKKQVFIMDDNVEYYIYIGIKGPIQLRFTAT